MGQRDQNYKKLSYDTLILRMKKGKKEEYRQTAEKLGLGQSEMFIRAIEEFIQNHSGESLNYESAEEQRVFDEFTKLSPDVQKSVDKMLLQAVNDEINRDKILAEK